jgi:hypothetical protein
MYVNTVKRNGTALEYVPDEHKTEELCEYAICNDVESYKFIPMNLFTDKICKLIVFEYRELNIIPVDKITYELCKLSVKINARTLANVPDNLVTKELCKMAVQYHGDYAIEFIPANMIDDEINQLATLYQEAIIELDPLEKKIIDDEWLW